MKNDLKLPRVIIHNAVSIDGRIDHFNADIGLFYEVAADFQEDATLAGSDTLLAASGKMPPEDEEAFLPVTENPEDRRPILAVPDSRGRIRSWHYLRTQPFWRKMIALCSDTTPAEYREYLKKRHVESIFAGKEQVDLKKALMELKSRFGVNRVRVDSGGTLNGILLKQGLVDEVSLLVHPALVGGTSPMSMFRVPDHTTKDPVIELRLLRCQKIKDNIVWLTYETVK